MNEKDQEKIDAITESMREIFDATQKTVMIDANLQLMKGVENPLGWQKYQKDQIDNFKTSLAKKMVAVEDDLKTVIKRASDLANIKPDKILKKNSKAMRALVYATDNYINQSIKRIHMIEKTVPLYDAILAQTQAGIAKGAPIVSQGRKYGFKEYMEMTVRTTLQTEISEKLLKSGGRAKIVFYICNVYGDCAHDHKDYQGKTYYDERWETFGYSPETTERIKQIIRTKKMLSVQSVRDNSPWLTTRPNCRHNLTPITIEQAGGDVQNTLQSLKLIKGKYRDDKYDKTQEQRKNERNIRFYKYRQEQNELLYKRAPSPQLSLMIAQDKMLVSRWQSAQRKLINANPFLERDYRRETRNIILQDLGVKYRLEPKVTPPAPKMPLTLEKFKTYEEEFYKRKPPTPIGNDDKKLIKDRFKKFIDEGDFALRLSDDTFETNVMVDKRFKNQLEVHRSGGYLSPTTRMKASQSFFGHNMEMDQAEEFEKYGYLTSLTVQEDINRGSMHMDHYGDVVVRFNKEKLKDRTTFMVGDSLDLYYDRSKGADILPSRTDDINPNVFDEFAGGMNSGYRRKLEESKGASDLANNLSLSYIELQYHGELLLKDVKSVTFTHGRLGIYPDDTIIELIQSGIDVYSQGEYRGLFKYDVNKAVIKGAKISWEKV